MTDPDPQHLELAALIRGALVASDALRFWDVSIDLDSALNRLVARDPSGSISPMPFDPECPGVDGRRGFAQAPRPDHDEGMVSDRDDPAAR